MSSTKKNTVLDEPVLNPEVLKNDDYFKEGTGTDNYDDGVLNPEVLKNDDYFKKGTGTDNYDDGVLNPEVLNEYYYNDKKSDGINDSGDKDTLNVYDSNNTKSGGKHKCKTNKRCRKHRHSKHKTKKRKRCKTKKRRKCKTKKRK
jgi:hypothetical protein